MDACAASLAHFDVKRALRTFEPLVLAVPASYKAGAISRLINGEQFRFIDTEHQQPGSAIQERLARRAAAKIEVLVVPLDSRVIPH